MRISDWSSDVCSSDLRSSTAGGRAYRNRLTAARRCRDLPAARWWLRAHPPPPASGRASILFHPPCISSCNGSRFTRSIPYHHGKLIAHDGEHPDSKMGVPSWTTETTADNRWAVSEPLHRQDAENGREPCRERGGQ